MATVVSQGSPLAGRTVSGPVSGRLRIDGQDFINFYGTGYFALSGIPEIRNAVAALLAQGMPFSQQLPAALLGAADAVFDRVEKAGALACNTETSIYFASGYLIGGVGLATLGPSFDLIAIDEHAHFNLIDAAKLCGRPIVSYKHCDTESLSDELKRSLRGGTQRPLVLTDGVFATTGRVPPLAEYVDILEKYNGRLFVDESHAFGVVGEHGRGAAEHCGIGDFAAIGATLSKALCAQGAVVGCSPTQAQYARNIPPLRGANSGSPLSAAAAAACINYVARHPHLRSDLHDKTNYLRARLRSIGVEPLPSPAPIVSFQSGSRDDMLTLQKKLLQQGIFIYYSTYLGAGKEGLIRCAVFRDHSKQDLDAFVEALRH